jgi:hypothetical protein
MPKSERFRSRPSPGRFIPNDNNPAPAVRFSNPPEALAAPDNLAPVAWPDWGFSFTKLCPHRLNKQLHLPIPLNNYDYLDDAVFRSSIALRRQHLARILHPTSPGWLNLDLLKPCRTELAPLLDVF